MAVSYDPSAPPFARVQGKHFPDVSSGSSFHPRDLVNMLHESCWAPFIGAVGDALNLTGLEVDGRTVDPDEQYLVAINRLFSEVAADGVRTFCKCERTYTHHQLFRDLVMDYLRERRHVSGELPGRLVPVTAVANVEATRQLASDRTCWQSDRREDPNGEQSKTGHGHDVQL